jgi:urease accessory protein
VRQTNRFDTLDTQGRTLGVALPSGVVIRGGDVLVAEDGSLIQVKAASQPVLKVTLCAHHGTPVDLLRAAFHLGQHHVPVELTPDHLKLAPDEALTTMLRQMHLVVNHVNEPFEPEVPTTAGDHGPSSAPAPHSHTHGDHHEHGPGCNHASPPAASPTRSPIPIAIHSAPAPHVHGPGCGHDH